MLTADRGNAAAGLTLTNGANPMDKAKRKPTTAAKKSTYTLKAETGTFAVTEGQRFVAHHRLGAESGTPGDRKPKKKRPPPSPKLIVRGVWRSRCVRRAGLIPSSTPATLGT